MKRVSGDDENRSIWQNKVRQILNELKTWAWQLHLAFNPKNREKK